MRVSRGHLVVPVVLILALSLAEFRIIILIHEEQMVRFIEAAFGVVIGEPHWRVYQNRVLGPYGVRVLSDLTGFGYGHAYMFTAMALVAAMNFLQFHLVRRLTGDVAVALRYTVYLAALFLLFQGRPWLYLWDFLDAIVFMLLVYGILAGKSVAYFVLIFAVGILNKESALFIPAWLILDSLVAAHPAPETAAGRAWPHLRFGIHDGRKLAAGAVTMVAGIGLVEGAREWLLVREKMLPPADASWAMEYGKHVHVKVWENLDTLVSNITSPSYSMLFLVSLFLVGFPIWLIASLRGAESRLIKLAILFLAILGSIFVLGLINETRVYIVLIPFILAFVLAFTRDGSAISLESASRD